jgi:hypothetical protein
MFSHSLSLVEPEDEAGDVEFRDEWYNLEYSPSPSTSDDKGVARMEKKE